MTVDIPTWLVNQVPQETHPDFGPLETVRVTRAHDIKGFCFTRSLPVSLYKNADGYTALSPEAPNIIGYGDNQNQAYEDWLMHLAALRTNYGASKDDELTKRAIRLRDSLKDLLRPTEE